jgi:hypothetical protein
LKTGEALSTLLAVRVVCPFLDYLFWRPAATVVPAMRGRAILTGLLLPVIIGIGIPGFRRSLLRGPRVVLVAQVVVPPAAMVTGPVAPVLPALPVVLPFLRILLAIHHLRGRKGLRRALRRLASGYRRLPVLFSHNCQDD